MNRSKLEAYIIETYSTQGELPWMSNPTHTVFRHTSSRKWFALVMDIPRKNLDLTGEGEMNVVNLKCDTRLIGFFLKEVGIFLSWHMNKTHWVSVALDGTVEDEKVNLLVDMGYELTKGRGLASPFYV